MRKSNVAELCKICNTRRPRRYCLGVDGDICAVCCGTEREVTVTCPYECDFLRDGRQHEKRPPPGKMTHPEIEITDNFMERNEIVLMICTQLWWQVAKEREGVLDRDILDAIGAFIQAAKTAESSGLIVASRPENMIAAGMLESFNIKLAEWREDVEQRGVQQKMQGPLIRDGAVLKMQVFMERTALSLTNGRPRCRAFLDTLRTWNERVVANAAAAPPE